MINYLNCNSKLLNKFLSTFLVAVAIFGIAGGTSLNVNAANAGPIYGQTIRYEYELVESPDQPGGDKQYELYQNSYDINGYGDQAYDDQNYSKYSIRSKKRLKSICVTKKITIQKKTVTH